MSKTEMPHGLAEFAANNNLSQKETAMLAGIHYRGNRPRTQKNWWYIFEAIKRSVSDQ